MYAIEEREKKVNGVEVPTFRRVVAEGNACLDVEAGTTGYTGSDCRNAGGRTFLRIEWLQGDFLFSPVLNKEGKRVGVVMAGCGDDALNALMKALGFCLEALADQCTEVDD